MFAKYPSVDAAFQMDLRFLNAPNKAQICRYSNCTLFISFNVYALQNHSGPKLHVRGTQGDHA